MRRTLIQVCVCRKLLQYRFCLRHFPHDLSHILYATSNVALNSQRPLIPSQQFSLLRKQSLSVCDDHFQSESPSDTISPITVGLCRIYVISVPLKHQRAYSRWLCRRFLPWSAGDNVLARSTQPSSSRCVKRVWCTSRRGRLHTMSDEVGGAPQQVSAEGGRSSRWGMNHVVVVCRRRRQRRIEIKGWYG